MSAPTSNKETATLASAVTEIEDCSSEHVIEKYRLAGEIAQTALNAVLTRCKEKEKISDLCAFGNAIITERCNEIFKTKKIEKGIAFPTCISPNHMICHYTPLSEESLFLKAGDWIKIDLGCHIDGYIAVAAHTTVVTSGTTETTEEEKNTTTLGPQIALNDCESNLYQCTYEAIQLCSRLIRPGNTNLQVTEALEQLYKEYKVKPLYGTMMHQMKRFIIDGSKMIALSTEPMSKLPLITFEMYETYAVDICLTAGENEKPFESQKRTTIYKRQVDKTYQLKMKASRYVLSEINRRFTALPFTLHEFTDVKQAKMGLTECLRHELVQSYPVLEMSEKDRVVHMKLTLLLTKSGNIQATIVELPTKQLEIKPTKKIQNEKLIKVLKEPLKLKKTKGRKKEENEENRGDEKKTTKE